MTAHLKNNSKYIFAWSIGLLTITLCFLYFFYGFKIVIFNKTGFDLDSLNISGKFYQVKRGQSLSIVNCQSLSIQAGLPFSLPNAIINGRRSDDSKWFYCGDGITEIKHGLHKFDINMQQDSATYLLYWTEHR